MKSISLRPENLFKIQTLLISALGVNLTVIIAIFLGEISYGIQWSFPKIMVVFFIVIPIPFSLGLIFLKYQKLKKKLDELEFKVMKQHLEKSKLSSLSFKEKEVFTLISEGKSNKEICAELFIELSTLKSHINHIYKKLDIKSRKEMYLFL